MRGSRAKATEPYAEFDGFRSPHHTPVRPPNHRLARYPVRCRAILEPLTRLTQDQVPHPSPTVTRFVKPELDVERLYRDYGHSVVRRARQILANDDDAREILQDIFTGLVARPEQFDQRSSPATFLYAVTTNACLARLRDRKNRLRLIDEQVRPWTTDVDPRSPETGAMLRGVLAELADDEARASVYYYLDGMTHAEVADALACSRRHVGNLLERVGRRLGNRKEAS